MDKTSADEKPPYLVVVDAEGAPDAIEIAARLAAHVAAAVGPRNEKPVSILAYDADGALIGGLNGASHWRWLFVRNLWIDPLRRGRGLGVGLLEAVEAIARKRSCVGVYIDTFDPAVAAFYARRGFVECGRIEDFPPGAQRIFLAKRIAD
jgi:GNAT superfamily N-acetyltransferase